MAAASLSAVIEEQIKALCLTSFPCGSGSWNQSCFKHGRYLSTVMEWESDNPQVESMDNLNDLLTNKHSPWKLEDDCGPETHNLRQLAITCPENITNQFIYSYFKCLRVINKEVSEVDEQLLQFHNLEELILSVNKIKTIDSSNLPRTLKVLELCSNQISSLEDLSTNPPPTLQHLGLAYNKIKCSTENIYLTTDHWPHLVSLDLSFNDLSDLFDLVPKLCTLKKLRLLNLQGNPLTFIYSYRAYTIDSLPDLCVLDDIPILPDERHQCLGLSKNNDGLGNSAQIYVSIGKIKGIPNPISISDLQSTEGYPVITYNYYVTYEFVEDQLSQQLVDTQVSVQATNMKMFEDSREKSPAMLNFPVLTGTYRTGGAHWMEVIDCVYKRKHTVSDLLALKAFLQSGMKVTLTEEKTLSWLLYPEKIEKTKDVSESGKKGAIKDKGRSSSKGSKPDSKSKKKKETIDDLRHDAPIVRTLGSVIMPLNNLTQGEMQVSSLCNFEILRTETEIPATAGEKNVKKSKDQKPEGGRESVGHRKTELSSGKGKSKNTAELKSQEEQVLQHPEPLTAEVHIHLHTWKSPSAHQTA